MCEHLFGHWTEHQRQLVLYDSNGLRISRKPASFITQSLRNGSDNILIIQFGRYHAIVLRSANNRGIRDNNSDLALEK